MPSGETTEQRRETPQFDIFAENLSNISLQHPNLENLTINRDESARLYSKTKETAERLGINDLLAQAGNKIDAVVKMISYEEAFKDEKDVVYMSDEKRDQIYGNYQRNIEHIATELPNISKHYVLMETLQTMFKESLDNGNFVYFDDSQELGSKTKLSKEEMEGIPPLLEIMKVDYLVNSVRPGVLNEDYARPLERIRVLMDDILTSTGEGKARRDQADVQEIFEEMVESLKFIGTQDPRIALNDIHTSLVSSRNFLPGNAIKYDPLGSPEQSFSINQSVLHREQLVEKNAAFELVTRLDAVTPKDVYVDQTTYHPRAITTGEKSNYDLNEVAQDDFAYFTKAIIRLNGEDVSRDDKKLSEDLEFLTTKNEQEGGMLSRIAFIFDSLTPLDGVSKGDLVRLTAAYVARVELNRLTEGSPIERRSVPMLRGSTSTNPERQKFFEELAALDGVFEKLFDSKLEEAEVRNAKQAVFRAVDAMRGSEVRWARANLTSDNIATEFPGVLSFVEAGTKKIPWGRNLVGPKGKVTLRGKDVSDGFPIN